MKIGITERGDPSLDYSWETRMHKVDGAILITKKLTNKLIERLKPFYDKVIVHVTCTGYGSTILEPNIPKPSVQIAQALKLISAGLPKENIVIRVDPIIPTVKGIERARKVIVYAANKGFRRFRISLIDMYPHVRNRFEENNLPLPYGKNIFSPDSASIKRTNELIKELKLVYDNIHIESCAEKDLNQAEATGCVGLKDLRILGLPTTQSDQVGFQRGACLCCSGKTELLQDKKQCPYKCLYCYWKNE